MVQVWLYPKLCIWFMIISLSVFSANCIQLTAICIISIRSSPWYLRERNLIEHSNYLQYIHESTHMEVASYNPMGWKIQHDWIAGTGIASRVWISNCIYIKLWCNYSTLSRRTLTHWGRATHICIGNLTIIGSDNGLSPVRRQAIIWTKAGILLIRP